MRSNGDPVLLGCRPIITYNNEASATTISLSGLTTSELESRVNNEIKCDHRKNCNNELPDAQTLTRSAIGKQSEDLAVLVKNVRKSYEKGCLVLDNVSMHVERGTIYGLLGSSGCGKTTLLSCIVGLKDSDSGEIRVFNKCPGTKEKRLGFMPQDIALYDQLAIREMLGYYGRLYGMSSAEVTEQWIFLADFLKLPTTFKLIKDLSGGQKRRVSLAITLVHSPELLILDEPTVGLDPLLRESIWQYLYKMVRSRNTTVILTTHYIEEARLSNTIGIMRNGRLIVEETPETLLHQNGCDLLEQVVLKLCRKDKQTSDGKKLISNQAEAITGAELGVTCHKTMKCKSKNSYNVVQRNWELPNQQRSSILTNGSTEKLQTSSMFQRVQGLSTVMWITFMRHPIFVIMILLLPTLQMLLTLAVLGTDPIGFKIGVVNNELPYDTDCLDFIGGYQAVNTLQSRSCDFTNLSCDFLAELRKGGTMDLVSIQSSELAYEQVQKGELWGYFAFPGNYSQHVADLAIAKRSATNETLEGSRVRLSMDMSNYLGAAIAIKKTYEAYEKFVTNLAIRCNVNPKEFQLPLLYREPVYGREDISYHDYVTPIVILTVVFEFPMLVTSVLFINDRKQGTLDRARVAGLRFKEVILSFFLTQGSVIIGQTAICYLVMKYLYNFKVIGSLPLFFFLCILAGISGESLGLLVGVFFDHEVESVMFGIFLGPLLLMYEGAIWPVEGMALYPWRIIAYLSPTTLIIESARSVIYRGLDITHAFVYYGIGWSALWSICFWIISISYYIKKYKV